MSAVKPPETLQRGEGLEEKKKKKKWLSKLHLFSVLVRAVFPMSHRDLDTVWLNNNIQSSKGLKAACPVRSGSHHGGLCHPSHAQAHGFVVPQRLAGNEVIQRQVDYSKQARKERGREERERGEGRRS